MSNFTTGFPVYFSHKWTPDFRLMEAVAASMSIPPAIKPLYNESDVVKNKTKPQQLSVQTDKGNIPFVNSQGKFILSDFYLFEHVVKLAIAQVMEKKGIHIDVNNTIDMSAFLEPMKNLVIGENDEDAQISSVNKDLPITLNQPVNGVIYTVDYALLKFFYNAAYKGMFFDGGYRNNIPYNYFRTSDGKLSGILAIKLDEHFPPPLMEKVYKKIRKLIEIEEQIDSSNLDDDDPLLMELIGLLDKTRQQVRIEVEIIFAEELEKDIFKLADETKRKERKEIIRQIRKNKKAIDRLVRSSIKHYRKKHLSQPWAQPKSILATAFEGYEYGSERGQVKFISDHSHILPLYDYGVGTYDFDMKKVQPQIRLAQAKAEDKTLDFFK